MRIVYQKAVCFVDGDGELLMVGLSSIMKVRDYNPRLTPISARLPPCRKCAAVASINRKEIMGRVYLSHGFGVSYGAAARRSVFV